MPYEPPDSNNPGEDAVIAIGNRLTSGKSIEDAVALMASAAQGGSTAAHLDVVFGKATDIASTFAVIITLSKMGALAFEKLAAKEGVSFEEYLGRVLDETKLKHDG